MFEHVIIFGLNFQEIFIVFILILLLLFLIIFFVSLYRNRSKINFYSLVVRENGRMSKVGIAFVFLLLLLNYQVISNTEVSTYLVELLGIIFAAELGTKYVDGKLTKTNMASIKNNLSNIDMKDKSASARNLDDIDFDKL